MRKKRDKEIFPQDGKVCLLYHLGPKDGRGKY